MPVKKERLLNLVSSMVDIYSPTGKEEKIVKFLNNYLIANKLNPVLQEVEKDRENIIIYDEENKPSICFAGHLDTVSASDYEHYGFDHDGDEVFGLGTSDMKGGCAAMIEAFHAFLEDKGKLPSAALALLVGEEEYGDGANKFLEEYSFSWAVIGEPTQLKPCFDHYGYIEASLHTKGKKKHASLAKKEENAVQTMLVSLLKITEFVDAMGDGIIFNIRDLFSSRSGFVVPDYCESLLDFHLPPHYPSGKMIVGLEEFIRSLFPNQKRIDEILNIITIHSGYSIPATGPFAAKLQDVFKKLGIKWETSYFPSDSDAVYFWDNGVKPIILGPGSLEKAHREDESAPFSQIVKAAEIYYSILESID